LYNNKKHLKLLFENAFIVHGFSSERI